MTSYNAAVLNITELYKDVLEDMGWPVKINFISLAFNHGTLLPCLVQQFLIIRHGARFLQNVIVWPLIFRLHYMSRKLTT